MIVTMENKKISIIGYGFVGKATDYGFSKNVEKLLIDPLLGTSIEEIEAFKPDLIFICLPTPMNDDGTQDSSLIIKTLSELDHYNLTCPIVIKSTVLPDILEKSKEISRKLVYNPEFLREKHAEDDFINSPMVILGGENKEVEIVEKIYKNNSVCKTSNYIRTDIKSASLIKYTINSFLATKVLFFNEIKNIFDEISCDSSWDAFTNIISNDSRIGSSHMMVPGHDGKKGFGGACFTKDTAALINYARSVKANFNLLESAVKINNKIRSSYKDLDQREKEQNVNYNFEN
jgi:UDPglucose 6-dehydrogenase